MSAVAQTSPPQCDKSFGLPLTLSPSAQFSYLAAQPSDEDVYTLYGHAGLRVCDSVQGFDVTFNYGLFNFSGDFVPRFIQGKTDYIVLPIPTSDYMSEYQGRGVIYELVLRTDSLQRAHLWQLLIENVQPEHRTYRYNAFRDNCSTRPLALYFATLKGENQSPLDTQQLTFKFDSVSSIPPLSPTTWRTAINELEASSPWLVLGTDLAMGTALDQEMSIAQRFFIPTEVARLLPHLSVATSSEGDNWVRPVQQAIAYGQPHPIAPAGLSLTHPQVVFTLLLLISVIVFIYRYRRKPVAGIIEGTIYLVAGLGGSLLCYLTFFSEHPMVSPNYNLLALHPLYLIIALLMPAGQRTRRVRTVLHAVCLVLLIAFPIVSLITGQVINPSVYLIALSLGLLSLGRLLHKPLSHKHVQEPTGAA
ncbi:lipoprotein N-acyltransferase Lnb domain-containing protein [Porphyromonas sp.]